MGIRPIDLGIMISKTGDVEKAQQAQQQQPNVAQQQLAAEELHKKEIMKKSVQATPKGEGGRVERKKDNEEGGRGSYSQNLKQQREEDAQADENKKRKPQKPSIDIRI